MLLCSCSQPTAVHSLEKSTLGQYICSYALDSDEILMSLSFSPSSEYLLVGVRSSKIFGCFLKIAKNRTQNRIGLSPPIWINSVDNSDDPDNLNTGWYCVRFKIAKKNIWYILLNHHCSIVVTFQRTIKLLCLNEVYPIRM